MSSESFLSRWSRRKQEVREAEQADRAGPAEPDPAEPDQAVKAAAPDEASPGSPPGEPELGADDIARLPSLEELTPETDLSLFLRKGVPKRIRNAALRRMWSLDPKIRDFVSEAREYAYDWNVPGGVPGAGELPPSEEWARMAARIVGGPASEGSGEALSKDREQAFQDKPEEPRSGPTPHAEAAGSDEASTRIVSPPAESQVGVEPVAQQSRTEEPADIPAPARRHGGAMPL